MSEFDLIRRYFTRQAPAGILGVGDDCALLPATPGAWAVSTDLLLENRHFFPDVPPDTLGHKALAVNLSDLAAMGAAPRGFVLGLALPSVQDPWLQSFSAGMHALSERYGCPLVGGDTTRSDAGITISVTIFGMVDARRALRRDAARPGDDIWVSGALGEADVALRLLLAQRGQGAADPVLGALTESHKAALLAATLSRLQQPEPRIGLGLVLAGTAHAAIDISDGLLQDLGHITKASRCGALLQAACLPLGGLLEWLPQDAAWQAALGGGDAYELCFTAPEASRGHILTLAQRAGVPVTRIGRITSDEGIRVVGADGVALQNLPGGFDHFGT